MKIFGSDLYAFNYSVFDKERDKLVSRKGHFVNLYGDENKGPWIFNITNGEVREKIIQRDIYGINENSKENYALQICISRSELAEIRNSIIDFLKSSSVFQQFYKQEPSQDAINIFLSNTISVPETEYDFPNDNDNDTNDTISITCIMPTNVQWAGNITNPNRFLSIGPVAWQKHAVQTIYWKIFLNLSDIIIVREMQIHITHLTFCRHWGIKIHAKIRYL